MSEYGTWEEARIKPNESPVLTIKVFTRDGEPTTQIELESSFTAVHKALLMSLAPMSQVLLEDYNRHIEGDAVAVKKYRSVFTGPKVEGLGTMMALANSVLVEDNDEEGE